MPNGQPVLFTLLSPAVAAAAVAVAVAVIGSYITLQAKGHRLQAKESFQSSPWSSSSSSSPMRGVDPTPQHVSFAFGAYKTPLIIESIDSRESLHAAPYNLSNWYVYP